MKHYYHFSPRVVGAPTESIDTVIKDYRNSKIAKGESNDCVVRALAAAFDVTYDQAHKFVAERWERKPRRGTVQTALKFWRLQTEKGELFGKKFKFIGEYTSEGPKNYPPSLYTYYKNYGETVRRKMTLTTFLKEYDKGTYFILVRKHAFTVKDGKVIGNSDDAYHLRKRIMEAVRIG